MTDIERDKEIMILKKKILALEAAHTKLLVDVNNEFRRFKIEQEKERKRYKSDIQTVERNIKRLS